jgi:hypothetical protein
LIPSVGIFRNRMRERSDINNSSQCSPGLMELSRFYYYPRISFRFSESSRVVESADSGFPLPKRPIRDRLHSH